MVARWGVLWSPLVYSLKHDVALIQTIIRLHNYCTENSIIRRQQHNRQVPVKCLVGCNIKFGQDASLDQTGECIVDNDQEFATVMTPKDALDEFKVVRSRTDIVSAGVSLRREELLQQVTELSLQRPSYNVLRNLQL